jgi:hypothetical protein
MYFFKEFVLLNKNNFETADNLFCLCDQAFPKTNFFCCFFEKTETHLKLSKIVYIRVDNYIPYTRVYVEFL